MGRRKLWVAFALLATSQILTSQTKEYIRINGKVVAIESIAAADYSVTSNLATVSVAQSNSSTVTITVAPTAGNFTGSVALSVTSTLPSGVTASFSPATVTVSGASVTSTLTLAANSTATTGTVAVVVTGTSGALSRTTNLNLITTLPQDFSLSTLSNTSVTAGSTSTSQTLTVTPLNGFNGAVSMTASGLPSGVTANFSPTSIVSPSWTSQVSFTATAGATLGTATVTLTGTNATLGISRTTTLQLTVSPQPTFNLSGASSGTITAGLTGTVVVTVSVTGGFSSLVTFGVAGLPSNVTSGFSPASLTGNGTTTLTLNVGASANPGSYPLTIQGSSTSPAITKTITYTLTILAAQQSIQNATLNPPGASDVTISTVVTDPTGAAQIQSVEFSLSTSTNSNTFVSQTACRFRVNRTATAGVYTMDMAHKDGSGTLVDLKTVGQAGTLTNDACAVNMAATTVSQGTNTWTISISIRRITMGGTHYVRAMTTDGTGSSIAQPYTYLNATWNIPVPPTGSFTNSQGVTPPVVYSSFNVGIPFTAANLGSSVIQLKLAQASDGSISTPSGTNPVSTTYTAGNSGENRDVILRALICSSTCTSTESNMTHEFLYTIRVMSSTSSPPSLNFTNPFTGNSQNPSPRNATATANGSTGTFINYGINNYPYAAAQCTYYPVSMCTPIQNLYLNINRTFTESALTQDRVNGCRVRVNIFSGGSPPGYYFFLTNDAGDYDTGFLWTPAYGGGSSIENSQCRLNIQSSVGAYAAWPYNDNTFLGIGVQYVFKTPFAGKRYMFMMGHRNSGDWSGWQYRGYLNLQ